MILLSAASADLNDWRDALHKAFERAGCHVFPHERSLRTSAGNVL
jgi:hypothetical protein